MKKLITILLLSALLINLSISTSALSDENGTVTLEAKLTKLLILSSSFTMLLSCDTDGNITIA